jgi:anti-sigma regulatory factor (Ser/Thr protein kinase)
MLSPNYAVSVKASDASAISAFPGGFNAPAEGRRFLERVLRHHPAQDTALLVVSELVTNAVRHSRSGRIGGIVTMTATVAPAEVAIRVTDEGPWATAPSVPAIPDDTTTWEEHGRGLHIVSCCATVWGVDHHCDGRTTVWAVVQGAG